MPNKQHKFHIKIQTEKKRIKKKIFIYDENANDIAEEEEETQEAHLDVENSSIIVIDDDSGCFSSDTSLKFVEATNERPNVVYKSKRMLSSLRTEINESFWDLDGSNEKEFMAIFVKKTPDDSLEALECASVISSDELVEEIPTVSIEMGDQFCLRNLEAMTSKKKKKKKRAVVQRKNELRKFKLHN